MGTARCKNCSRSRVQLFLVEVEHPKTQKKLNAMLCEKCKETVEYYCRAPTEIQKSCDEYHDDLDEMRARQVKRMHIEEKFSHGFEGTACRVDVYTFVTSRGTEGIRLTTMSEKEKKWGTGG